jgi:outer membrane protein assembly factor BamB
MGGPVISGGLVWVGTNDYHTDEEEKLDNAVLACFRESDGKLLHRQVFPRLKFPLDWPSQSLSGSPLTEGNRIWFCNNRREVISLEVGLVKGGMGGPGELWKFDMVKELKIVPHAAMIPWPESYGSPAAYKELLFVPTGNSLDSDNHTVPAPDAPTLICLRKDTGKLVWSDNSPGRDMMPKHLASPLVVEVAGGAQVIHPQGDGWVRSFEAETGKLLWKFDLNRKDAAREFHKFERHGAVATPVYANGKIYFAMGREPETCSGPGKLYCIDPSKSGDVSPELEDGPGKGKPNPNSAVVWELGANASAETDKMHLTTASVAVHKGLVVAVDHHGYVHCLDEKTGKQHWSQDLKGSAFASPLIVDGVFYVGTEDGTLFVFALSAEKKLIAKREFDAPICTSPVFANGVLYVLTEKALFAIQEK